MKYFLIISLLVLALGGVISNVLAQTDTFELNRFVISGGGGVSSGGVYLIYGAAGQVRNEEMNGGIYRLRGGFQPVVAASQINAYLPLILKN